VKAQQMLQPVVFEKAERPLIRKTMRALYESSRNSGGKVPHINKTIDEVSYRLKLSGYSREKSIIKSVAEEDEFKKLREPRGVRHNNKGIPRRRRRSD
jgi:hypothetical protein